MPFPTDRPAALRLLAFDTSTERLAIALAHGGGSLALGAAGGAQASATLLPRLRALLDEAGLAFADLDFIAFGRGPGAFTGLRTACAVAQGIALALDKPVLAIDSLMIVAEDARPPSAPEGWQVAVAMDARMDEAYAARYRWQDGRWQVLQAPALYTLAALARAWEDRALDGPIDAVAGSALAAFGDRLALPPAALRCAAEIDRAAALLRLAQAAAAAGEAIDAAQALPLYLRDKVALTSLERAAVKAAPAPS